MKKLLILSGKGGTGKTTIASSFIRLSKTKFYADCDVEAPNLQLVTIQNLPPKEEPYFAMDKANIDQDMCTACGLCKKYCNFEAIFLNQQGKYQVDSYKCEGCSLCKELCKNNSIKMVKNKAGKLKLYKSKATLSTGDLDVGQGNSGLLVTQVKKNLDKVVVEENQRSDLLIIDGPPGIGCPVIASISGVDMVLLVTEPSISGINDLERVVDTCKSFKVDIALTVNKYDVNKEKSFEIEAYCKDKNIVFLEPVPFSQKANTLVNQGKTLVEEENRSSKSIEKLYNQVLNLILEKEEE